MDGLFDQIVAAVLVADGKQIGSPALRPAGCTPAMR